MDAALSNSSRKFSARPVEGLTTEPDHGAKLAYTIAEAAKALGLGESTVYDLIYAKRLRRVKAGRRALIPADSLRAFVASLPEPALPKAA